MTNGRVARLDWRGVLQFVIRHSSFVILALFLTSCRTTADLPPVNLSEPGWTQRHLCFVIFQIAKYCELLETHGVFPGDINYRNFLIDPATGVVGFIDCDSYQVSDHGTQYPCRVYMPEFQPPEVLREKSASLVIGPDQVIFSAAILFFMIFTAGGHPYQVKQGGTQEENILAGRHFIGPKGCANGATTDEMYARYRALQPCPYLMSLFKRTFIEGHANPSRRPRWREWKEAIKRYDRILLAHAA